MSFYNMIFGRNAQSDLLLAVLGLRTHDVERFRDVYVSEDGSTISVYTRTGGGNREGYPNGALRHAPGWQHSEDDDFDSTYCTDTFAVPEKWRKDVLALRDVFANGVRKAFAQHLAKTLCREPTEDDKAVEATDAERRELAQTRHLMANGHTFVPLDDSAMDVALRLAEANGGELRSCWGIKPIALRITGSEQPYPKAQDESARTYTSRAKIDYDFTWTMDEAYWQHCVDRFGEKYPKAITKIAESLAARKAA